MPLTVYTSFDCVHVDTVFTEVVLIFKNESVGGRSFGNTASSSRVSAPLLYFHGHVKEILLCCLIFNKCTANKSM